MQADVERLLAQLFVDGELRERFLLHPMQVAGEFGLSPSECDAVAKLPTQDLLAASRSYERKRHGKQMPGKLAGFKRWTRRFFNTK
ncbi:MAG TPA: hypothetical protein VG488_02985 [Candidatus Angelobacter sp.]|jgi:hypothetical protein|nr:hypothetical protein [Candidatus Angelobacter sp.]